MPKEIQKRFYSDPEWYQVEEVIKSFIDPLMDMTTVDTSQPAEAVKAEIIGRTIAYTKLSEFLNQTKLIGQAKKPLVNNPFQ